jgi:hypothetical protein
MRISIRKKKTMEQSIETLAAAYRANLVPGKRELVGNGHILVRAEGSSDSLQSLCYAVHKDASDSFPSDWLYLFIGETLDAIAEHGEEFYQDTGGEEERYHVLASWLAECPDAAWHCDELEMGEAGIYQRLEAGYRAQWENVGNVVLGELTSELEELAA